MSKEIRMPFREYQSLVNDRKQLKKALDKIKNAKNVIVLDYEHVAYRNNGMFGSDEIAIPKITGNGIGAYSDFAEKFDEYSLNIEKVRDSLEKEIFAHRTKAQQYEKKKQDLSDKARPWKIAFYISCVISIILILMQLINP